jgi:hypothetical protein
MKIRDRQNKRNTPWRFETVNISPSLHESKNHGSNATIYSRSGEMDVYQQGLHVSLNYNIKDLNSGIILLVELSSKDLRDDPIIRDGDQRRLGNEDHGFRWCGEDGLHCSAGPGAG